MVAPEKLTLKESNENYPLKRKVMAAAGVAAMGLAGCSPSSGTESEPQATSVDQQSTSSEPSVETASPIDSTTNPEVIESEDSIEVTVGTGGPHDPGFGEYASWAAEEFEYAKETMTDEEFEAFKLDFRADVEYYEFAKEDGGLANYEYIIDGELVVGSRAAAEALKLTVSEFDGETTESRREITERFLSHIYEFGINGALTEENHERFDGPYSMRSFKDHEGSSTEIRGMATVHDMAYYNVLMKATWINTFGENRDLVNWINQSADRRTEDVRNGQDNGPYTFRVVEQLDIYKAGEEEFSSTILFEHDDHIGEKTGRGFVVVFSRIKDPSSSDDIWVPASVTMLNPSDLSHIVDRS